MEKESSGWRLIISKLDEFQFKPQTFKIVSKINEKGIEKNQGQVYPQGR